MKKALYWNRLIVSLLCCQNKLLSTMHLLLEKFTFLQKAENLNQKMGWLSKPCHPKITVLALSPSFNFGLFYFLCSFSSSLLLTFQLRWYSSETLLLSCLTRLFTSRCCLYVDRLEEMVTMKWDLLLNYDKR